MNKAIPLFQKQLRDWYIVHCRPLPWRDTSDPYCIWISEVMLQQTQVKTVTPYYKNLLKSFGEPYGKKYK